MARFFWKTRFYGAAYFVVTSIIAIAAFIAILIPWTGLKPVQAQTAPWTPWSKPYRLLPYMADAVLAQNPVDLSVGYVGANKAYGIVSGNDQQNWQNDAYLKLGDAAPPDNAGTASGIYDEFGTLHAVWSGRTPEGFAIFYNRVLQGSNNVGLPRNLSQEFFGGINQDLPAIAYSHQQKKLFLVFGLNGDGSVMFSESADQGSNWTTPLKLGVSSGGLQPVLLVDNSGNPHLFYSASGDNTGQIWHLQMVNGSWSNPENTGAGGSGGLSGFKAALAPGGDIWVAWSAGMVGVTHRAAATGKWQTLSALSGAGVDTGWPAIAVGSSGAVWVMWINRVGDNFLDWRLEFTVSYDNGQHWKPAQVGFVFNDKTVAKDFPWTRPRPYCLDALYAKGLIYMVVCTDVDDPKSAGNSNLLLATVPENWDGPALPTPTPLTTGTLTPSPVVSLTLTPVPTITTNTTAGVDAFEPDNTLAQAVAAGNYLVANGAPQVRTLFDPSNADRHQDIDVIPFMATEGKYYTLEAAEATGKNLQLKLSLYSTSSSGSVSAMSSSQTTGAEKWLGATNECSGDTHRLCFTFKAEQSGLYFGQFSNYLNSSGSPDDWYSLQLLEQDNPPLPLTATPVVTSVVTLTAVPTTSVSAVTTAPVETVAVENTPISVPVTATAAPSVIPTPTLNPVTKPGSYPTQPPVVEMPTATPTAQTASTPSAAQAQDTAQAAAQNIAAQTPLLVAIPVITGGGGIGPRLVLPTSTLSPTRIPTAIVTTIPATVSSLRTPSPGTTNVKPGESKTIPPQPGAPWMPVLGFALLGKGILNLLSLKTRIV